MSRVIICECIVVMFSLLCTFFTGKIRNLFLSAFVFAIGASAIILVDYNSQVICKEVWSGSITSVKHIEEYTDPPYYTTETYTDKKGKTHTEQVYHPEVHHPAENYIYTTDNGIISVYETLDGVPFTDDFVNSNIELEFYFPIDMPTASVHFYENKVQASNSIYKRREINIEDYPGLPEYPLASNERYSIDRFLGDIPNKEDILIQLDSVNTRLNQTMNPNNTENKKSYKQVNMIYVNLGDVDESYGYALQDYWNNGNKNDFIIAFGSKDNKVTWCYPFSWCEVESLKKNVRDYMNTNQDLNTMDKSIKDITDIVEEQYVRKEFTDFKYLDIEPGKTAKILIYILMIACIVMTLLI